MKRFTSQLKPSLTAAALIAGTASPNFAFAWKPHPPFMNSLPIIPIAIIDDEDENT